MRRWSGANVATAGAVISATFLISLAAHADDSPHAGLWTRPTLLEGAGSPKAKLRQRGVAVDTWVTQFYQGVVAGDAEKDWQYGDKADVRVNLDGHKLGLWRGFSVHFHQEWVFGEDVNSLDTGALIPVNTAMAFPRVGGRDSDTSLYVNQKFGDRLSVSVGKFNLLDTVALSPIKGGGGLDTYWNMALALPFTGLTPPYILGSISNLKTDRATYTLMVYDPRNAQDSDVLRHPFAEGVTIQPGITVPTRFFDLAGSVGLKVAYSTKEGLDLSKIPQAATLPPESQAQLTQKGSWSVAWSGEQYIWQNASNPKIGWGFFYELAISDENPNPLSGHYYVGVGGSHKYLGHGLDRWGIGYFDYRLSGDLTDGLAQLGIDLRGERGVELFYNVGITPWLRLTADLQWIEPFKPDRDDVVLTGFRLQTRF